MLTQVLCMKLAVISSRLTGRTKFHVPLSFYFFVHWTVDPSYVAGKQNRVNNSERFVVGEDGSGITHCHEGTVCVDNSLKTVWFPRSPWSPRGSIVRWGEDCSISAHRNIWYTGSCFSTGSTLCTILFITWDDHETKSCKQQNIEHIFHLVLLKN